jgi:hypothetical protein
MPDADRWVGERAPGRRPAARVRRVQGTRALRALAGMVVLVAATVWWAGAAQAQPLDRPSEPPPPGGIEIREVSVEETGSWIASIGATPHRVVVVTVENTSGVAIAGARVSIAVSREGDGPESARTAPVGTVRAGEQATVRIPFELGAFAVGDYTVSGTVTGTAQPDTFVATTSAYPWLLFGVAVGLLLVVIGVVVARRRRPRRRGATHHQAPAALPRGVAAADGAAIEPEMIDSATPGAPITADRFEQVIVEQLGLAMGEILDEHRLANSSPAELAGLAAQVAYTATRRTAHLHPIDAEQAHRLLVGIFGELTAQLGLDQRTASACLTDPPDTSDPRDGHRTRSARPPLVG